jgi:hypothetical protein
MNYVDDFLEVINDQGDPQVQLLVHSGAVLFEGEMRCRSGAGYAFFAQTTDPGPPLGIGLALGSGGFMQPLLKGEPNPRHLRRLCEYPTPDFLGKCPEVEGLRKSLDSGTSGRKGARYRIGGSLDYCRGFDRKGNDSPPL